MDSIILTKLYEKLRFFLSDYLEDENLVEEPVKMVLEEFYARFKNFCLTYKLLENLSVIEILNRPLSQKNFLTELNLFKILIPDPVFFYFFWAEFIFSLG
jgi:hypothetical protein